jgi:hypothetical protein
VRGLPHPVRRLKDNGLQHFGGLTSLQYLGLGCCESLTDAGLKQLRSLTDLRHLDLCIRVARQGQGSFRDGIARILQEVLNFGLIVV